MFIDITSFFFNSIIEGATATPAWGTSIGQSKTKNCRIESDRSGVTELLTGMIYKSKSDRENFDLSKGSQTREYLIYSIFEKVYINGLLVPNKSFIVLLSRENSKSHSGRLNISYPPYATYKSEDLIVSNEETIREMRKLLGCKEGGCWFGYDISVKNQDELYFSCVVVNSEHPMVYKGTSAQRSSEWNSLIPEHVFVKQSKQCDSRGAFQTIFYGAPGTGKSHTINEQIENENVIRTTFHPDSDYSTFVGAYKPTTKIVSLRDMNGHIIKELNEDSKRMETVTEDRIVYEFVSQAFLQAYIQAWKFYSENEEAPKKQYLIIEEINRGNCAQIFGDLFQLLDRNQWGFSDYPINADKDMKKQLGKAFKDFSINDTFIINAYYKGRDVIKEVLSGDILLLPNNLFIWATMNTCDQSLFPIDSAFKRRWNWEYIPIEKGNKDFVIEIGNKKYDWWNFISIINGKIDEITGSEDKKLGYWFAKPAGNSTTIKCDQFVSKVLFYLWNDVYKDYTDDNRSIFRIADGNSSKKVTFTEFFGAGKVEKLYSFMQANGIIPISNSLESNNDENLNNTFTS